MAVSEKLCQRLVLANELGVRLEIKDERKDD